MTDALAPRHILAETLAFVRARPGFVATLFAIDAIPQMAMAYAARRSMDDGRDETPFKASAA